MASDILRVRRTKEQARESYDKLSMVYDCLTWFERKYSRRALELLDVRDGEKVLEIGFGTGRCLRQMAESVGKTGEVYGLDISQGMLKKARRRLEKAGVMSRVELYCGDALHMPHKDSVFDAVFMSFTLELFDTPEIPRVLAETRRVLKPHGRLGVVSMSNENGDSLLLRLYRWAHEKFPKYVDCRPIYVEKSIKDAGYEVGCKEKVRFFGLSGEIVRGYKSKKVKESGCSVADFISTPTLSKPPPVSNDYGFRHFHIRTIRN